MASGWSTDTSYSLDYTIQSAFFPVVGNCGYNDWASLTFVWTLSSKNGASPGGKVAIGKVFVRFPNTLIGVKATMLPEAKDATIANAYYTSSLMGYDFFTARMLGFDPTLLPTAHVEYGNRIIVDEPKLSSNPNPH